MSSPVPPSQTLFNDTTSARIAERTSTSGGPAQGPARLWIQDNQRYLSLAVGAVVAALEAHVATIHAAPDAPPTEAPAAPSAAATLRAAAAEMAAPPAMVTLAALFGLSAFEQAVLALCAGVELDHRIGAHCGKVDGTSRRAPPTFGLALAALPDAHWSALTPASPLRRWHLVELDGTSVTQSPLRIDERILHYLTGIDYLDARLEGFVERASGPAELVPSHARAVERMKLAWETSRPILNLLGADAASKRAIVMAFARERRLPLLRVAASRWPATGDDIALARIVAREGLLTGAILWVDADDLDATDPGRSAALERHVDILERAQVVLTCRDARPSAQRSPVTIDVHKPTNAEQAAVWHQALSSGGERSPEEAAMVRKLTGQFSLSIPAIRRVCAEALASRALGEKLEDTLWDAARKQGRPRLDDLAQRIEPRAQWDDLVLPEPQLRLLREIVAQTKTRSTVYHAWGFASKGDRGLGVSALFAGPSGTGKTMAAEVVAATLRLDLYRIDLSQVVSKYIGETEKNLRRVFDTADEGGVVLLFDEADALFGKRSEVQDSHDRYANIEVSYLLQRMEAYSGLAILTTNFKAALDSAFSRRIRFAIDFRFPSVDERARIWRRIFPAQTPTEGLDHGKLARLNVAGGNIRNIALHAAFLAASEDAPVRMPHVLRAAQVEYQKLDRPLTEL